ncbi:hypothetical protein F5876DRAFT_67369 [Lentinula aff. lateritia]|uniref:Uncharacterized protein n=1 Tax=Lentinula aff. lateritia TaxID=2804960 RepID=A0ACC1TUK8_9AGAR|nr:hypothetical protein F5876DRAFT_67369 [Lentinula aff. lateritia]
MIISSDIPPSPAKSHVALSNPQSPLDSPPPPAYGATAGRILPSQPQQYQPYIGSSSSSLPNESRSISSLPTDVEANEPIRRESPGQRFCKAFAVALLIYVLAAIFLGSFSIRYQTSKGWHSDFSIPNNIAVVSCTKGSEMQNGSLGWVSSHGPESTFDTFTPPKELSAKPSSLLPSSDKFNYGTVQTSLTLPLTSETLFLLSRGRSSTGVLRIKSSSDLEEGMARVDVKTTYTDFVNYGDSYDSLSQTAVCLIQRKPGKRKQLGIGLFSSRGWPTSSYRRSQLTYDVTLVLPESRGPSILRLNAFETDLPNFHHFFSQPLDEFVTFGNLLLKAGNGIINAVSLTADNATIHTSNREINIKSLTSNSASLYTINSEIRGHFTTSHSLEIKARNTKVKADIEILPQYSTEGGDVVVQTTNKALEATINVHRPSQSSTFLESSSSFFISTTNNNGIVDVSVPSLPPDSALNLTASTTNGRVTVALPATYEGTYALSSTNIFGEVHNEHTEDPAGLGRKRVFGSGPTKGAIIRNSVYWDERNKEKCVVVLQSINGQAELFL